MEREISTLRLRGHRVVWRAECVNGNKSISVFELEMKFSESKGQDRQEPANYIKEVGIYLTGHGDAAEGFKIGE